MAKEKFIYEFERNRPDQLSFECSLEEDEKMQTTIEDGVPFLYLNRRAMITLAQLLIKLAKGDYSEQFHVHLRKDFNDGLPECLTVLLDPDDAPASR